MSETPTKNPEYLSHERIDIHPRKEERSAQAARGAHGRKYLEGYILTETGRLTGHQPRQQLRNGHN